MEARTRRSKPLAHLRNKERQLSPEELKKNHERKLTSTNPQAPKVLVNYNYISREFQKADHVEQYIMHFSIDGDTIQRESEEYKIQEEILETRSRNLKGTIKLHDLASASGDSDRNDLKKARRIMRNKFNYSERDTQTPKVIIETKLARTAKPELVNWCSTVNQSMIYDLYLKDKLDKEKTNKDSYKDNSKEGSRGLYAANLPRCLKIMERMIVQNEQQQIYREYKYMFSDKDTEVTKKSHTWVALWNFNFANTSKKNVTSICWNPKYSDMFVIGYGIYAFGKKKSVGYICICSLKNNKNSEMVLQTDGDVMSLDFHPTQPALLAVGLYDGVVLVFDIRNKTNRQPIYQSSIKTKKHTDPVWQVKWNANPTSADVHNFYSISSDGRVMNWILMKDKLEPEEVIRLKLVNNPIKSKMSRFRVANIRKQAE